MKAGEYFFAWPKCNSPYLFIIIMGYIWVIIFKKEPVKKNSRIYGRPIRQ